MILVAYKDIFQGCFLKVIRHSITNYAPPRNHIPSISDAHNK